VSGISVPPASSGRVVHVIAHLQVGGAQQLLVTWAKEAERRRDPVTVVSLSSDRTDISAHLQALGVEVLHLPRRATGPLGILGQVLRLRRLLVACRPDAVQTHLTYAHLVGLPAARSAGVPCIGTLHSMLVGGDGNSRRALWWETQVLRRFAGGVLACGAVVERNHRDRLRPRRAVVVPNATEAVPPASAAARLAMRDALELPHQAAVVLAVGRLAEGKGYDDLLRAFVHVAGEQPSAVLVIVGNGPLTEHLQDLARRTGIGESVRLLGQRRDIPAIMGAADLYVSASHWEGLPLAMLEAMSARLPVLVTSVGDVPTVVDEACGVLVPPQDPAALAGAMSTLLREPTRLRLLGEGGQRRVTEVAGVQQWYDAVRAVHAGPARGRARAWPWRDDAT